MKRVYLFCSAGMSTSLVARSLQDVDDDDNQRNDFINN